ncbi:hypothetical protein ACFSO7_16610 [Bacillus sp. CGMCC 1.16607]|uniref:hypothetical protein n=1 Tax=Bacillus sp. CGMCC 1.16607 TaxID=3351842 RepID=UPI0036420055
MSDYKQFLTEKEKIDELLQKGYVFLSVVENLNGSTVDFYLKAENKIETVQLGTANGRKYFSTLLMVHSKNKTQ